LIVGVAANLFLIITNQWILHLFGSSYVMYATQCLLILTFGVFPLIIRQHFIAICRIENRISSTLPFIAIGSVVELLLATLGAHMMGLTGLASGWVGTVCIEAVLMAPSVYRAVRPKVAPSEPPAAANSGNLALQDVAE
jgi:O-antigen/teichoic acid export membrane protein